MPTILIVDDDDAIRGVLYDLLSLNYECHVAGTAEEALQYMQTQKYDLILTDIAMPGLTGVELLQKIRERDSNTPVIMISGRDDTGSLGALGAFAYVMKPFDLNEMEAVVERAIAAQ